MPDDAPSAGPAGIIEPGWYPDPKGSGQLRWWNGKTWTGQVRADEEGARPSGYMGVQSKYSSRDPRNDGIVIIAWFCTVLIPIIAIALFFLLKSRGDERAKSILVGTLAVIAAWVCLVFLATLLG